MFEDKLFPPSNFTADMYRKIHAAVTRQAQGALYVVDYPLGIDGLHYQEALRLSFKIAKAVDEAVILRMNNLDQLCTPQDTLSPIFDHNEQRFLSDEEFGFRLAFSGVRHDTPFFHLECRSGLTFDIFVERLENFSQKTGLEIVEDFNGHRLSSGKAKNLAAMQL